MARHDYSDACGLWLDVQLREVVYHVCEYITELQELGVGQAAGPPALVVVTPDCRGWRNCAELLQYPLIANIASVEDVVAAAQERSRLGPQKAMGVSDEANAQHDYQYQLAPPPGIGRHQNAIFCEKHVTAGGAEKPAPPRQYADPDDGQVRCAAAILRCKEARRPFGPHELHGAHLRFNGINGTDLHQSKETYGKGGLHWYHNASTLNGYLISRHIGLDRENGSQCRNHPTSW